MRKLVLALLLLLLVVSCSTAEPEFVQITLSNVHNSQAKVNLLLPVSNWGLVEVQATGPPFEVFELAIGDRQYIVDDLLAVYNPLTKKAVVLTEKQRNSLVMLKTELEMKVCGIPLPWSEVDRIFARMDTAVLVDFATGKSFKVQRRGGTYHADVQPLTKVDTAMMKEIYGGKWSWDRRAVLVLVDDMVIAASMNGMPHGQGALANNFPGHFCLHFTGSITHATRSEDLGHQLMIAKAAGTIWSVVREATPEQQVLNLAAALNQKDLWLAQLFMDHIDTAELERRTAGIDTFEIHKAVLSGPAEKSCKVAVSGEIIRSGGVRAKLQGTIELNLCSGIWRVNPRSLLQIIN